MPDYAGIARAAAGGELWAERATSVSELDRLLPQAIEAVLGGRGAVLDAVLGGDERGEEKRREERKDLKQEMSMEKEQSEGLKKEESGNIRIDEYEKDKEGKGE